MAADLYTNGSIKSTSARVVGSMGQRKSGALGALGSPALISTEEEQLKFQDSRFLTTLVLGRSRKISPDVLPSCSPGVFRQKSFRSSTPPKVQAPVALSATTAPKNKNLNPPATVNNRCVPCTISSTTVPATAFARDSGARAISLSLSLSRSARSAGKHTRLGPALATKMASASSSTVVQGWPNTKDDYELKEVIVYLHRSPEQCAPVNVVSVHWDLELQGRRHRISRQNCIKTKFERKYILKFSYMKR